MKDDGYFSVDKNLDKLNVGEYSVKIDGNKYVYVVGSKCFPKKCEVF